MPTSSLLGDPHAIPDPAFPADGPPADQLRFLLHYAALAPSVLNTQPWRFDVEHRLARIYADRTRQLCRIDPDGREMTVSCGAALFNLRVAARHFHRGTEVYPFPVADQPDLVAALLLHGTAEPSDEDERLFRAIAERRTNRHPFADGAVPTDVIAALKQAARQEQADLVVLTGTEEKAAVARLVEEGIRIQRTDPRLASELDAWLRPEGDPRRDGVADGVQGLWDRRAHGRTPTSALAAGKRKLIAASPALLVLTTDDDDPGAWLAAGQALERVLLTATAHGLQASYANQPVEVAALRSKLADLTGGRFPQVVFRVGFPSRKEGTPRRHMQDVLLRDADAPDTLRDDT